MKFQLTISVDNDEFAGDVNMAVADVLRRVAHDIDDYKLGVEPGKSTLAVRDINGNTIGAAQYLQIRRG